MRNMGIEDVVIAPRSPWQNPYVERLIGSIRREVLNHVLISMCGDQRGRLLQMLMSSSVRSMGAMGKHFSGPWIFGNDTSSNVVGCSSGRSAGLAPFRILSTAVAARRSFAGMDDPSPMRLLASTDRLPFTAE